MECGDDGSLTEIARLMGIGFTTVRTHLKNAMHKTGASNRTELAVRGRPH
ncbi:LuxR C-terminal-related transcriptional regulator [Pseudomonas juntendi]